MDDRYDFSHTKRGYMAIIVNDSFTNGHTRKGSDVDMINLIGVAKKLGLSPVTKKNVTKSQMMQFLLDLQKFDFSECDTFAFAISTHGFETPNPMKGGVLDHALVCTDDELMFTSTITEMFSNECCPTLSNKPKMFFIEACRGGKADEGCELLLTAKPPNNSGDDVQKSFTNDESKDTDADIWVISTGSQKPKSQMRLKTARESSGPVTSTAWMEAYGAERHNLVRDAPSLLYETTKPLIKGANGNDFHSVPLMDAQVALKQNIVEETLSLHCEIDQLVFFATPPGTSAWRNKAEGSWMISDLYSVMCTQDTTRPFDMLKMLTKAIAKTCQRSTQCRAGLAFRGKKAVPVIEHKLTRDVVIEPKSSLLFDDAKEE